MIGGITLKVCGLARPEDAAGARRAGADYLGFNLYPPSPRFLGLEKYRALAPSLPPGGRVAVMVEPSEAELAGAAAAGFDRFQIHFRPETPLATVARWSQTVGTKRLWLAPKLPPEGGENPAWLPLADVFLLDAFRADLFGGTGRTGDWAKFARLQAAHPEKSWILAGGLGPENLGEAIRQSAARFVDVNSGVESAPGLKDHAKLDRLAAALRSLEM